MKHPPTRPSPPAQIRPSGKGLRRPAAVAESHDALPMPHERDEGHGQVHPQPDPVIEQASRDLQDGQVDTDMRATPGLDAQRRAQLVGTTSAQQPPGPAAPRKARATAGKAAPRRR